MAVELSYSLLNNPGILPITVEDLFQRLSFGELSNLAMAVDATGTIQAARRPQVIHFANEALTRLYSKFLLEEGSTEITVVDGQISYPLPLDALQVLEVYDSFGLSVPLNNRTDPDKMIVTPTGRTLTISNAEPDTVLEVVYQAKHAVLAAEPLDQQIFLPDGLYEALTSYIAAKMWGNLNTPEAMATSAMHQARYDAICNEGIQEGWINSGNLIRNVKFRNRGWV